MSFADYCPNEFLLETKMKSSECFFVSKRKRDLKQAFSREENYIKYETLIDKVYRKILSQENNYCKLNMNRSIDEIAQEVRKIISREFGIGKYAKEKA